MSALSIRDQAFSSKYVGGHRAAARARWRLRATRADLVEFGSEADPDLARVTEELDLLEIEADARP